MQALVSLVRDGGRLLLFLGEIAGKTFGFAVIYDRHAITCCERASSISESRSTRMTRGPTR